jgi:excisionase family DNA binding protein
MKGLTIIESEAIDRLTSQISGIEEMFRTTLKELQEAKKPWMTMKEVCEYMGKGSTWLDLNKGEIGFSKAGGEIRFKRKDVDAYLESRYYKSNSK